MPQWSPVMKTGNTCHQCTCATCAALEQGYRSSTVREYVSPVYVRHMAHTRPQWSPVMKTGNTRCVPAFRRRVEGASMEPGHEDREYLAGVMSVLTSLLPQWSPVMKTGNTWAARRAPQGAPCLNGARS